jgi:hypothetical protein
MARPGQTEMAGIKGRTTMTLRGKKQGTVIHSVVLALLIVGQMAYGHGGNLDATGGHHDRKNGGY